MKTRRITKSLAALAVIATIPVLVACSSDVAAPETAESGTSSEPLIIGTSGTYNPITFSDGGTLAGYDIDWGNAIGEKLDREVEWVEGPLAGLLTGLQSSKYDLVMSALTMNDERKAAIDFSDAYLADGVVAVVGESNTTISSIEDLAGLRVGVIGGSGYQTAIEELGGYSELVEYTDAPTGFADLKIGRIDVFAAGKIPATTFVNNDTTGGEALKIAGEPLALLPAGVGIAKGDTELTEQVNAAIAEIKSDADGDAIAEKWFGFTIPGVTN